MKKTTLLLISIFLILILAACGGQSSEADISEPVSDENALSLETQLVLGTVKLDETAYAVGVDQASELLPLWKALRSLGGIETASQTEVDAVISQIQDTMTPEQMEAITAMALAQEDFAEVAETLGIEMGFSGSGKYGDMTPEEQVAAQAAREESGQAPGGGQVPGGGVPGMGGGLGRSGGQELSPEAREMAIAERGMTGRASFGLNTALLDGIIKFLEAKVSAP
ncbi:MAG: hypothetical protein KJ638_01750 [Chloroflexi bacterium]|nr:hypothetical protein [Chloroflexota bacterium]